ncbi:MAG: lipoprotein [Solirubrobacteraceae bacterium]
MRRILPAIVAAVVLAGCGNAQTPPPDIGRIPAPASFRDAIFAEQGVFFRAPTNWRIVPGDAPQVATVAVGNAQIGVWRYPRSEPLPETRDQLKAARQALVAQVRSRDPTFRLTSSRLVMKPGLRGVLLVGSATNQGQRRRVRSLHAYGRGAEVVVDAFAPPKMFPRVDKQTFAPVARSLKLRMPRT